jgi:hypothetical protein
MKKQFAYILTAIIFIAATFQLSAQDYELQRWVFGSGGSVMAGNSEGDTLRGLLGQTAIFTRIQNGVLYQGFWVPGEYVGVEDNPITLSPDLMNYPNPFSNHTTIRYTLPGTGHVSIRIYDMVGRLRKSLAGSIQGSGQQEIIWDGKDDNGYDCATGSYLYELRVSPYRASGDGQFKDINLRNVMVIVR